jgi:hypothetical protein
MNKRDISDQTRNAKVKEIREKMTVEKVEKQKYEKKSQHKKCNGIREEN